MLLSNAVPSNSRMQLTAGLSCLMVRFAVIFTARAAADARC